MARGLFQFEFRIQKRASKKKQTSKTSKVSHFIITQLFVGNILISYELMQQEKRQNELKTKKRGPVNF